MPTRQNSLLLCTIIVTPFLLTQSLAGRQSMGSSGPIPEGWFVYPDEKLKHLDEKAFLCFNYSQSEWKVTGEGAVIRITKQVHGKTSKFGDKSDELLLPPQLKHEQGMPGRTVRVGLRSALHFRNDWLLAYDGGEWGGGLWLTNDDGSKTKRILNDNVRAMIPMGDGVLVLSGLSHVTIDFGNAFLFSNPDGMNISLRLSVPLDSAPSGYAKQADGSVIFVTEYGLCRITRSGNLQKLHKFPRWGQSWTTNSIAFATDGSIFIGMRMFVLRLHATPDGYAEEWLLPNDCRTFSLQQYDCVCRP